MRIVFAICSIWYICVGWTVMGNFVWENTNYQNARVLPTNNKFGMNYLLTSHIFSCNLSTMPSTYEYVHGYLKQSGTQLTYIKVINDGVTYQPMRTGVYSETQNMHDFVLRPWRESMQNFICHLRCSEFLITSFALCSEIKSSLK